MAPKKILIVEDDRSLAGVLEYNFSNSGYDVFCAHDGVDAINQARAHSPDVIVLDVMIPLLDGIDTCKRLRSDDSTRDTPILMLTAKGEESDHLTGFSAGADDYVVKPFSVRVLMERVKSLLRRHSRAHGAGSDIVISGPIKVDRVKHRVSLDGTALDLTPSEFRLLDTLIRNPGRAFERSQLIDSALGGDSLVLERTIDVHIRSLRKKLGESAESVETVRGVGYRFRDQGETGLD